MRTASSRVLLACVLGLGAAACGDDAAAGAGGAGGGGTGSGGAPTTTGSASGPVSVSSSASGTSTSSAGATSSASAGTGGGGGGGGEFIPTPESIDFAVLGSLPEGEQILFNDWNAQPNTVASMGVDGDGATPIFEAFRVWSLGVSADAGTIAFASGDPLQEEHYGLALGDAIQHTFLFDVASEAATALTWGNINDECHQFSADGSHLYVCRRSDFRLEGETFLSDGYYVGRVDLGSGAFERLLPPDDGVMVLSPQPDPAETTALVQWIDLPSERSIRQVALEGDEVTSLREDAGFPVRSPDGQSYLFSDYTAGGTLWSSSLAGGDEILVADRQASNARFSPDGTRVVYLLWDDASVCSHVEIVAADGSEADTPTRIRDCSETGEFITEVVWIER